MDQDHLHHLLSELHQELVAARSVEPKDRDLLRHLADDIRSLVEAAPARPAPERYQGLRGRLAAATTAFEASHPRLTAAMEKVIDTLAVYNL
jgi:uncharacterized heparinase superfamily protein